MPSANDLITGQIAQGGGITPAAQSALATTTAATVSNAMPSFNQALQGVQENAVRRGITTGDLGTSYEGDLASAFQRNTANAVAGQAAGMYEQGENRYDDLLTGQRDYDTAQANANKKKSSGLWGAIGTGVGAVAGSIIPGVGTVLGAELGGAIGGGAGGY